MLPSPPELKADYGIDAPGLVRGFALIGLSGVLVGLVLWRLSDSFPGVWQSIAWAAFWSGLPFLLASGVMLHGSRVGKYRVRDRIIAELQLQGHEQILDVGCGRGLMLLGMAKQLTTGRAVGIDLWRSENAITTTEENSRRENVADKVELHTGDLRELPFEDGRFDVVISTWAVHAIPTVEGRLQALRHMHRVLKPGGTLVIDDISFTLEYLVELRRLGMKTITRRGPTFHFVIPSYQVWATK